MAVGGDCSGGVLFVSAVSIDNDRASAGSAGSCDGGSGSTSAESDSASTTGSNESDAARALALDTGGESQPAARTSAAELFNSGSAASLKEREMYQEDLEDVIKFAAQLPRLRQQVSDSGLLDLCQSYLNMLVGQMQDSNVQLGPRPEQQPSQ